MQQTVIEQPRTLISYQSQTSTFDIVVACSSKCHNFCQRCSIWESPAVYILDLTWILKNRNVEIANYSFGSARILATKVDRIPINIEVVNHVSRDEIDRIN